MLQYPLVIREAAKVRKKGVGVHIEVAVKKVSMNGKGLSPVQAYNSAS